MSRSKNNYVLKVSSRVLRELTEIRQYIDEQRGLDPPDEIGLKTAVDTFTNIREIGRWPWVGTIIPGMNRNYRKRQVSNNRNVYYFVNEAENLIIVFELRHTSQRPLAISTIEKYKREAERE